MHESSVGKAFEGIFYLAIGAIITWIVLSISVLVVIGCWLTGHLHFVWS